MKKHICECEGNHEDSYFCSFRCRNCGTDLKPYSKFWPYCKKCSKIDPKKRL